MEKITAARVIVCWPGVDIDAAHAARSPYERAYLRINRLEDGTMFDW